MFLGVDPLQRDDGLVVGRVSGGLEVLSVVELHFVKLVESKSDVVGGGPELPVEHVLTALPFLTMLAILYEVD